MPESRNRKKDTFTPPPPKAKPASVAAKRWVAPVMVACFVIGLLWMVVFYLAGADIPGMSALGNWNLLIGMGLIAVGFIVSTQWQ
ncbi:MAG TPA: cell division protein CrgA [Actinopolymorphaceae bacterium]